MVTLYLLSSLNEKLRPKLLAELKPGTRIVSHSFRIGDWEPEKTEMVGGSVTYLLAGAGAGGGELGRAPRLDLVAPHLDRQPRDFAVRAEREDGAGVVVLADHPVAPAHLEDVAVDRLEVRRLALVAELQGQDAGVPADDERPEQIVGITSLRRPPARAAGEALAGGLAGAALARASAARVRASISPL